MLKTRIFILCLVLCLALCLIPGCRKKTEPAPGDNKVLSLSNRNPVVDGKIGVDEYDMQINLSKMKLSLSRTQSKVYFALQSDSMGWVAIGFGAAVMNQAKILMGYVKEGVAEVIEQTGIGRRHMETAEKLLLSSALTETAGSTIFEGEVAAEKIITNGQGELAFIVAYGDDDDFDGYHGFRQGGTVNLR